MQRISTMLAAIALLSAAAGAQNPVIHDQYTADPTARVFGDRVYLYPSHDIPSPVKELKDWFCMADYHVFSSDNLNDWTDHGVILSQETVPWVRDGSYAMWAPDCVERDGRYYFYFPAAPKGVERGFGVGMAVADSPVGPFTPMAEPISGIMGIDPCVLVDDDGQAYIYWSGMGIRCARLGDDMNSLATEPVVIEGLPEGFKEGPFAFKRDGIYYLTFPWVRDVTETLAYATSTSPTGPFEFRGLIMEESPTGCWTNHHSLCQYKGQWYLFYHHNDYSPNNDKRRSARIDTLSFNPDGTIQLVRPTLRGVGVADAYRPIQLDRYTSITGNARIDYIDKNDTFAGWYITLDKDASVRFDRVDFGAEAPSSLRLRLRSRKGATLDISCGDNAAACIATVTVPSTKDWTAVSVPLVDARITGAEDLQVSCLDGKLDIDYIVFDGSGTSAGTVDGTYFTVPTTGCSTPDVRGFIRRWWLLDPIDKPNRTNTVFTDSYLREAFGHEYFPGQLTELPHTGETEMVGKQRLQWHNVESTGYNVQLYRYASTRGCQVYGVLFWVVTVIDCPEEIKDVRLSVGSNSASMWWLDGEEVLLLSGDRRMVADDAMSRKLTLHKGRNVLRGAVINGPGMSGFCTRFIDCDGNPVTNYNICQE